MPLSRRLDRCDRVIQNESRDPNGDNVCLFSAVTCRLLRHNANFARMPAILGQVVFVTMQITFLTKSALICTSESS